jgi:hypothetical protein
MDNSDDNNGHGLLKHERTIFKGGEMTDRLSLNSENIQNQIEQ